MSDAPTCPGCEHRAEWIVDAWECCWPDCTVDVIPPTDLDPPIALTPNARRAGPRRTPRG